MPNRAEPHTVFQFRLPVRLHRWLMDHARQEGKPAAPDQGAEDKQEITE